MPPENKGAPYWPEEDTGQKVDAMGPEQKARFAQFVEQNPELAKRGNQGELMQLFLAQERANEAGNERQEG